MKSKNVLAICDLPGYSKVALSAILPILANLGHNVCNLPTALVSNPFEYGRFALLDTTDYMKQCMSVWTELGFSFDCITTGFLASAEQVRLIRDFIVSQKKDGLLVLTDPVMGDDGALYNGVSPEAVENMRGLIGVADVIVPNLTEAEFLAGLYEGREQLTQAEARQVIDGLRAFGTRSVVITSGAEAETGDHVVWGYDHQTGEYFRIPFRYIKAHFPGTGDMFASVLLGCLLEGKPLYDGVKRAMDVLEQLIFQQKDNQDKNRGLQIENFLTMFRG